MGQRMMARAAFLLCLRRLKLGETRGKLSLVQAASTHIETGLAPHLARRQIPLPSPRALL
jgi:hypothetical protein